MRAIGLVDAIETAVLVAPALLVYGAIAYRVRRRRRDDDAGVRTARELALGIAIVGIGVFTLLPGPSSSPLAVELVPIRGTFADLRSEPGYGLAAMAANVALFLPLGFALRLVGLRVAHAALVAAGASVLVELLQWLAVGGRVVSTDDVLLNAAGGLFGAAAAAMRSWHGPRDCRTRSAGLADTRPVTAECSRSRGGAPRPAPYTQELRERALARLAEPGETVDELAREFGIDRNSVRNWKRQSPGA